MATAKDVFQFWFEELDPQMQFAKSAELDQRIRDRFLKTYQDVVAGKTYDESKSLRLHALHAQRRS